MIQRLLQFDAIKLFAIFLVCYGHCIQHLIAIEPYKNMGYMFIYSFHMPLFMMLSGYFSYKSMESSYRAFISKNVIRLIVPCISWSLIICFIRILFHEDLDVLTLNSDLWFLKSLFICLVLTKLVFQEKGNRRWIVLVFTLLISQVFPYYRLCYMYPAFLLGCLIAFQKSILKDVPFLLCSLVTYILMIVLFLDENFFDTHKITKIPELGGVTAVVISRLIVIITGLSGAVFFITFANQIEVRWRESICKYGRYTLGVYLFQTIFIEHLLPFLCKPIEATQQLLYLVIFPLICILTIVIGSFLQEKMSNISSVAKLFYGKYKS